MTVVTYPNYTIGSCGGGGGGGGVGVITTTNTTMNVGAVGSSGYVYTSGTAGNPLWSNPYTNATVKITGNNPTISTDKSEINLDELAEIMKIMRERFLIIVPDFEKHEKYEALKKAYDHYKMLEALVVGDKK